MNDTNCFAGIDTDNGYKFVFIAATVVSVCACVPGLLFVIWFERFGSDKKRTLLNKLVASNCWNAVVFNVFVEAAYIARLAQMVKVKIFKTCLPNNGKKISAIFVILVKKYRYFGFQENQLELEIIQK
jgi:hypothetical protein